MVLNSLTLNGSVWGGKVLLVALLDTNTTRDRHEVYF